MIQFQRQYLYQYDILYNKQKIGSISFAKRNRKFIIGFLVIEEEYRGNRYGYKVIEYILSHYKIDCIVGETVTKSRGFWNKCIKKYNGQRKNISTCDNCSSSFIIPHYNISDKNMERILDFGYDLT